MKIILTFVICFGLAVVFSSCGRKAATNATPAELKEYTLMNTIGDALTDKVLLTEIREGRVTNAINILEYSIDCSILEMVHMTNYDLARQQQVVQTFHLLKEYRLKYPRAIQTNAIGDNETKEMLEASRKAELVLDKVK